MFGVSYFCVPISMLLYKWGDTLGMGWMEISESTYSKSTALRC